MTECKAELRFPLCFLHLQNADNAFIHSSHPLSMTIYSPCPPPPLRSTREWSDGVMEERRAWQGMKAAVNSGHYFKRMFHTLPRQGQLAKHNVEAVIEHTRRHTHTRAQARTHTQAEKMTLSRNRGRLLRGCHHSHHVPVETDSRPRFNSDLPDTVVVKTVCQNNQSNSHSGVSTTTDRQTGSSCEDRQEMTRL